MVTPKALDMIQAISDRRIRKQVSQAISALAEDPDIKGKALIGELAGFRAIRAAGQRYRVIYRVEKLKVLVVVVAAGQRKEGSRKDIYSLASKLFRQRLLSE
ncbi:MAG: type II toxin-antitoxin system RelE/ParE family toxin [bacterium]